MAAVGIAEAAGDIKKYGFLIKAKTSKKKLFVLRDESSAKPARLEYYDTEKKFHSCGKPKRTIVLKDCFSIITKCEKSKYSIVLLTKEDCFQVVCENESEADEWFKLLKDLQSKSLDQVHELVWAVQVKSKGLGSEKVSPGNYIFRLSSNEVILIQQNKKDSSDKAPFIVKIPLDCIRRLGNKEQFFYLELGRSTPTGQGTLWLEVDDGNISQSMHQALVTYMRENAKAIDATLTRGRSNTLGSNSGRSRGLSSKSFTTRKANRSNSTTGNNQLSPSLHRTNESTSSDSSLIGAPFEYHPLSVISSGNGSTQSLTPTDGRIEEESPEAAEEGYFDMKPLTDQGKIAERTSTLPNTQHRPKTAPIAIGAPQNGDYMDMHTPTEKETDDYMNMGKTKTKTPTDDSYMKMAPPRRADAHAVGYEIAGSNSSVSSVISSVGSTSESTERSFHSMSKLQEAYGDGGYADMTPTPLRSAARPPCSFQLDSVLSYVHDDIRGNIRGNDTDGAAIQNQQRACSWGSQAYNKYVEAATNCLGSGYLDMSGRHRKGKDTEKSSSAPHLNDEDLKKTESSDLFMELDFNRKSSAASGGKDFRGRASSGGPKDFLSKAKSFTTSDSFASRLIGRHVAQSLDPSLRVRTSTICQDSLRPRVSSFGPTDTRPRSSTTGNSVNFKDLISSKMHQSSSSGSDLQWQHGAKIDGGVYMEMHAPSSSQDAGYVCMQPTAPGSSDYLDMRVGKTSKPNTVAPAVADYMEMSSPHATSKDTTSSSNVTSKDMTSSNVASKEHLIISSPSSGMSDYMDMSARNTSAGSVTERYGSFSVTSGPSYVATGPSSSAMVGPSSLVSGSSVAASRSSSGNSDYMEMRVGGPTQEKKVQNDPTKMANSDYMSMAIGSCSRKTSVGKQQEPKADKNNSRLSSRGDLVDESIVTINSSGKPVVNVNLEPNPENQASRQVCEPVALNLSRNQPSAGTSSQVAAQNSLTYATLDLSLSSNAFVGDSRNQPASRTSRAAPQHEYTEIDFSKTEKEKLTKPKKN